MVFCLITIVYAVTSGDYIIVNLGLVKKDSGKIYESHPDLRTKHEDECTLLISRILSESKTMSPSIKTPQNFSNLTSPQPASVVIEDSFISF